MHDRFRESAHSVVVSDHHRTRRGTGYRVPENVSGPAEL